MEILNHLVDLSDYGIEYTEEDKRIFVQFQDELINAGYEIKYMNTPVEMTENGLMTALSNKFDEVSSGYELFKDLTNIFVSENKYNHVFNNIIYIYTLGELKCIKDNITYFVYTIRIGTDYKFN
jgi:hypothetical protein